MAKYSSRNHKIKDGNIPATKCTCQSQRFEDFRRKGLHCDITLTTPANPYSQPGVKAHKIILAAASPFFTQILEGKAFRGDNNTYTVHGLQHVALEPLVKFIYTGELELTLENLLDLYHGSKRLELEAATRKCEAFIVENLNEKNVWQKFKLCKQMASAGMSDVVSFIQENWDTVTSCVQFLDLTYEEFAGILTTNPSEDLSLSMFNSINAWVRQCEATRKCFVVELLKLINLKTIPVTTLVDYFSQSGLMDNQDFQNFVRDTLMSICLLQSQQIMNTQETPVKKHKDVFSTPVKEEEFTDDEDDIIMLPTPPSPAKTLMPEKSSSIPLPIITGAYSLCTPTKPDIPKKGFSSSQSQSSPYSLSRKRNLQARPSTQSCKKAKEELLEEDKSSSMEDFSITSFLGKAGSYKGCVEYFTRNIDKISLGESQRYGDASQGRLFHMAKNSIVSFDISMKDFRVVNFLDPDFIKWNGSFYKKSCLVYYSGNIFIVGGISKDTGVYNGVSYIDVVQKNWNAEAKLVQARYNHTVVECKGNLYAIGGSSCKGGLTLRSMECLDLRSSVRRWNTKVAPMLVSRQAHGTVVYDGKIYAVGGYCIASDGSGTCLNTVESYDPCKDEWSYLPNMRTNRCGMAVAVFKDKLYVIGGGSDLKSTKKLPNVEVYNFKTGKWARTSQLKHARQYGFAVVLDGFLCVIGGDSSTMPTVEVFLNNKWEMIQGTITNQGSFRSVAAKT